MRQRFEQQFQLGTLQISDTEISSKTRYTQPKLAIALLLLFNTPEYNERLFAILESKICGEKKKTGPQWMDLWQIFVLAMFRMTLNISYDRLHTMANRDSMLRQLLGIETESGFKKKQMNYQTISNSFQINRPFCLVLLLFFCVKKSFKQSSLNSYETPMTIVLDTQGDDYGCSI